MKLINLLTIWYLSTIVQIVHGREYVIRLKHKDTLQKFFNSKLLNSVGSKVKDVIGNDKLDKIYSFGDFNCLSAKNLSIDIVERLKRNPFVADVVPNLAFEMFEKGSPWYTSEDNDDDEVDDESEDEDDDEGNDDGDDDDDDDDDDEDDNGINVQYGAPRHLGRISSRGQLPFDIRNENEFKEFIHYYYEDQFKGSNIAAYILDTGIYAEHPDFENRVIVGADMTGEGPGDSNGHGTHVAGILGSKTFGVAKNVTLVEVKVLTGRGSGNLTTVLSGIQFAVDHCRLMRETQGKQCVANMSLGTVRNNIINAAIHEAFKAGLIMVVAAGNSNVSACWTSPASAKNAITVGAFDDRTETIAYFSNWGACVDIFAPGVKIRSLSNSPESHHKHVTHSGTSMASPVVAGLAAILLDKGVEPFDVKDKLLHLSTKDVFNKLTLFFKYGTPNKIAYNGIEDFFENEDDAVDEEEEAKNLLDRFRIFEAVYPIIDNYELAEKLKDYKPSGTVYSSDDEYLDPSWVN
ncbi:hypothetical protein Kpol_1028p61 [Vanderwaltozyma polyspora DSM 70294]|uniref:Peptidase S8/S53 domain-containing protein n=1 Tax=Vanderwaltozyma polyspora (strain ATCC 22028 / DSM 70294 / BCRC 21397 / CBS 2163 / NBRC 10782 / NRRL Y-8283 / UCD 57-17) TaxID=436907 RepID=A7TG29_VANPO|nr:uncharacterized protein Kpol_1028p61 [Vanderwaltozyma polyspora DSM 70294]EDO18786.1 hypothetical protein Kpol_1028p61 [Vanderwaltozyma polyspora DSM 70294]